MTQPDNHPDKLSGLWIPVEWSAAVPTVIPTKCLDTGRCAPMQRRVPPNIPPKWRDSGLVRGGR